VHCSGLQALLLPQILHELHADKLALQVSFYMAKGVWKSSASDFTLPNILVLEMNPNMCMNVYDE